jgi:predicted DNA-binding transcriptional regulator AlpA
MDNIKIQKVTNYFAGGQELVTYKEVASLCGLTPNTALVIMHHDKFAEGRPVPFIVGKAERRFFPKSAVLEWITPHLEATRARSARGVGRPRKS